MVNTDTNYICISEQISRDLVAIMESVVIGGVDHEVVLASGYFASDRSCPSSEVFDLAEYWQLILENVKYKNISRRNHQNMNWNNYKVTFECNR